MLDNCYSFMIQYPPMNENEYSLGVYNVEDYDIIHTISADAWAEGDISAYDEKETSYNEIIHELTEIMNA